MTRLAPRDAPLEVPSVKGEASGLRSTDWTAAPLTEKAAPTMKLRTTLGSLIPAIMLTSPSVTSLGIGTPKNAFFIAAKI